MRLCERPKRITTETQEVDWGATVGGPRTRQSARTCRLPHRSDFVCSWRDFDRTAGATAMPLRDPHL